ncbi:sn-glycerol-3-phosphate ABC transporter substrate-binding protein UgpB [soil metagenome]
MKRLKLIVSLWAALALFGGATAQTNVELWHGLGEPLGGMLESIVAAFNASQDDYVVTPAYRGTYTETLVAAIAASRAGNAPHIVQMFEVGTATMMAAGDAIVPVHQLMEDTSVEFDPDIYIPAIRGYYSLPDGSMMSMPFNSSTAVMWYNKDAFREAGLDPEDPPETWDELREAARQIVDSGTSTCGFTTSWPTWTQIEQFSAIHDVPIGTRANGMEGLDTELMFNSDLHVRHLQTLLDMQAEGSFTYGGRDNSAEPLFPSGECAIIHTSSAFRARVMNEAQFDWGVSFLPYYDDVEAAPNNSIIGGASFWVMTAPGRTDEEYRAVAEFFRYISQPEVMRAWHTESGYLPIIFGVHEELEEEGFYEENPGLNIPYEQLTRSEPTENSRGLRFGNMVEIRNIHQEEMEAALQGQQSAQQALDNAVERGNTVLRAFERANR